ncbi:MAG: endolytic transglycosylase MltG [Aestuariivita sp.]|nr:endolytic transglycosylase MltG [Aestuariivita sp.]MCY4347810.1 endolytic transglycosylase MltG [Aestuariivita sp.]
MVRSLASNGLTLLIVVFFLLASVILWGQRQYYGNGPLSEAICLRVERGASMTSVGEYLRAEGAISSAQIFQLGADYTDKTSALKAGRFLIEPTESMEMIVEKITAGGANTCGAEVIYRVGVTRLVTEVREINPTTKKNESLIEFNVDTAPFPPVYQQKKDEPGTRFRVSLAEGVTSWQVTEALKQIDVLTGDIDDVPIEGSLAPESYEFVRDELRAKILKKMQDLQKQRVDEAWSARFDGLPLNNPEEMLILASIIEKESGVAEERAKIASVFVNRLNRGMRLQTDPTVIYGITKGREVLGRGLRRSELTQPTPWNTYVIDGLPPTPIANPGRASIQAASRPDDTPYFFFVADGTGGHAFAQNLAEHNRNVTIWRRIEAERNARVSE